MLHFLFLNLILLGEGVMTQADTMVEETVVRQGVDTFTTKLILQDISQGPYLRSSQIVDDAESFHTDFYGCGSCLSNLKIGDSGVISSPNNSSASCVWLLHTTQAAEIQIVCTSVNLPQCKAVDSSGSTPAWSNVLIISPTWQFTKSWVYCGRATDRLGAITHISTCNKMAVIYRADNKDNTEQGEFTCSYQVIKTYK
eukprot:TRINITY_DN18495_c0_g1_i1.p1 TRINITY_DN18495_c0_g1~~TRINITY_DN18495_c0_g1_i1.p1  ORF type:complete len:198 (-),score=53.35 TRINITY_DN18495_c0_g1_i1:102-695(-)